MDFQRIAEDVRAALGCEGREARSLLAESAADYAAAVDALNERLRECGELLKKGLRSEALQLCEREPNLLDAAATLDLPELAPWQEQLRRYKIAVPPTINLEIAGDLNAAYALEQPLTDLLRRHRLLALARAPLNLRIDTLRRLSDLDQGNPAWHQDLRDYERARFQEMQSSAELCLQRNDLGRLQSMLSELQAGGWHEPVPPALRNRLETSTANVQRVAARQELAELEPRLNQAFAEYDEAEGLQLRAAWDAAESVAGLAPDDRLLRLAQPALQWLDQVAGAAHEQSIYQLAKHELEQGLDEGLGLRELERLHHTAISRHPLPPVLEQRYQERAAALELTNRRRTRLIIAATSFSLILVAGSAGWAMRRHFHAREIATHTAALHGLLSADRLAEADEYLSRLKKNSPAVEAHPHIGQVVAKLTEQKSRERQRAASLATALDEIRQAGVEKPAVEALARADSLSRTPEEKLEVEQLRGEIQAAQRRQQATRDEAFAKATAEVAARVDALEGDPKLQLEAALKGLEPIATKLKELLAQQSAISPATYALAPSLQARVTQIQNDLLRERSERDALPKIDGAGTSPGAFQAALESYVKRFPDSPRAHNFQRVLTEDLPAYFALEDWQTFGNRWQKAHAAADVSAEDAVVLAQEAEALLAKQPDYGWTLALPERIAYLKLIGARAGLSALTDARAVFADPVISKLWMVQDSKGKRYYLTSEKLALKDNNRYEIDYLTSFDLAVKKAKIPLKDFEGGQAWHGEAPQSVVANQSLKALQSLDKHLWETTFLDLCELTQSQPRIEPIVQVLILSNLLDAGCQGSVILEKLCRTQLDLLKSPPFEVGANWVDPFDENAARQSQLAKDFVAGLPDFKQLRQQAVSRKRELATLPTQGVVPIGWLFKEKSNWSIRPELPRNRRATAFILARPAPGKPIQEVPLGEIKSGRIELKENDTLLEGRIVFVKATAPAPSTP